MTPILGMFLPRFVLKRMIARRQRRIQLGLADGLDLAVICIEAGLGLDQALQRVSADLKHAHADLSDELGLVNLEMRAGKPRAQALRNLAERTSVNDIRALVAVLLQTDRFGTSLGPALRSSRHDAALALGGATRVAGGARAGRLPTGDWGSPTPPTRR